MGVFNYSLYEILFACVFIFVVVVVIAVVIVGDPPEARRDSVCSQRLVACRGQFRQHYRGHSELLFSHQLSCGLAQNCQRSTQAVHQVVQGSQGE